MSFSLSNCQVEEIDNSINSAIQTVKPNEAILFLQNNKVLNSNKKGKTITFSPDLNSITLEKLTNSDQLLTVVPLDQNLKDKSSRILLLKINNEIKSVIFTMFATSSPNSKHFSGKIIITDLNGIFINGFSVKDGFISAKLKKKAPTNTTSRTIIIDGVEFEELDEVIIINNYQQGPGKFTLLTLFYPTLQGGGGPYDGINWEYENNGGGGGGSNEAEPVVEPDPCSIAKDMTQDALESTFLSATSHIQNASSDGLEHSITLGRDANGNMTQAPMNNGTSQYLVLTNTSWPGAFAALHNHPGNTPLSSGDIYSSVKLGVKNSNFATTYILTNGEVYAIVVTDLVAAQAFVQKYPSEQLPGYSPEFPTLILDQISDIRAKLGESTEARTSAIASVLNKYNSGISLIKQDSNGNFYPIMPEAITDMNGNTIYTNKDCN